MPEFRTDSFPSRSADDEGRGTRADGTPSATAREDGRDERDEDPDAVDRRGGAQETCEFNSACEKRGVTEQRCALEPGRLCVCSLAAGCCYTCVNFEVNKICGNRVGPFAARSSAIYPLFNHIPCHSLVPYIKFMQKFNLGTKTLLQLTAPSA
jgi:hypothetical protein